MLTPAFDRQFILQNAFYDELIRMESTRSPNRQSIRMKGWDYTSAGCYFVTINTHASRALFGTIVNGRMVLNAAGRNTCRVGLPSDLQPI
ncbi:MAG: hypothetical protein A2498_15095 [Lentisphaerae bacterium RIFOXYC12_FULL_60_16]|nr:MAG: hypothetical protein A2498_15095 [Lentisphaerae bacterium RIFOXYC12_FULL_60_16]